MELPGRSQLEQHYFKQLSSTAAQFEREFISRVGAKGEIEKLSKSFWTELNHETLAIVLLLLSDVFERNSQRHGASVEAARSSALIYSLAQANVVADNYVKNSQAIAISTKAKVQAAKGGSWNRQTTVEVADRIFGKERVRTLVATEFTNASVSGSESTMTMLKLKSDLDEWITHTSRSKSGVCKRCGPLHGTPRRFWGRIFPNGPPAHPNCRCEIRYYRLGLDN